MLTRARLAIAAIALASFALPGVAHADPDTVITFDDLPANTPPADFYLASAGIQFGNPGSFGLGAQFPPGIPACGTPSAVTNGISGKSMAIGCSRGTEFRDWRYEAAINLLEERRGVSFNLRSLSGATGPITVSLVRDNGTTIEARVVALPAGAIVPVSFTHATADINVVVLTGDGEGSMAGDGYVELDDLHALKDAVPPAKKFVIGLTAPLIEVPEEGTSTTQLAIRRINGSSGPITLSVPSLPSDITAVKIEPNPVTGTESPVLSITADSPAAGDRQIEITATGSATAGTNVSLPIMQTARIVPALVMPESLLERSAGAIAGCPVTYTQNIQLRGGFTGPIDLDIGVQDGGSVVVSPAHVRVNAIGPGTLGFPITLIQPRGISGASFLTLVFTARELTRQTMIVRVNVPGEAVTVLRNAFSFGPTEGLVDQWLPEFTPGVRDQPGSTQIAVEGVLPDGCAYAFQDDLGQKLPIVRIERGRTITQEGQGGGEVLKLPDRAILQLPADPRSTAVTDASGLFGTTSRINLHTFRNTHALNATNSGVGAGTTDFTWSDFLRTFGSDDGDLCTPFGCVRDPKAMIAWHFVAQKLESGKGLCFGWSTMSLRFERRIELPSQYEPLARYAAQVGSPEREGSGIKQQVVRWQASQQDIGWQEYKDDLEDNVPSPGRFHDLLRDALIRNDAVALSIRSGDMGHAVVAYDMRDYSNGVFEIFTYNSNWPYSAAEESSTMVRDLNTRINTITVGPNAGSLGGGAWIAYGSDSVSPWVGDMSTIEIFDRLPPADADLPINPHRLLMQLANQLDASGRDATKVTQITVAGKNTLRPNGEALPGTGVRERITPSGQGSDIGYELTTGKSYDLTLRGTGAGGYTEAMMGGGTVATVTSTRARGESDHVIVTPGEAQIGFAGGGAPAPATIDLATDAGKVTHSVQATLGAGAGRSDSLGFSSDHSAVTLRHDGAPTSVVLTLSAAGAGVPGSVTTRPLRVGSGQRLNLRPAWRDLAAGVMYAVTNAQGKVLRSGRAGLQASTKVRFARGLSAKLGKGAGGKRRVQVTGTISKRGTAPLLVVTAQTVRGGKVVGTDTTSLRGIGKVKLGRFSLSLPLRKFSPGARLRVTATLLDEDAGLQTARIATTAR